MGNPREKEAVWIRWDPAIQRPKRQGIGEDVDLFDPQFSCVVGRMHGPVPPKA